MRYSKEKVSQAVFRRPATTFIGGLTLSDNKICENCHSSLNLCPKNDDGPLEDLVVILPDGSIEENEKTEKLIPSSAEPEVTPRPEVSSPPEVEKLTQVEITPSTDEQKTNSPRKVATPPEITGEKNATAVDRLVINHESPRAGTYYYSWYFFSQISLFFFNFKTSFCR